MKASFAWSDGFVYAKKSIGPKSDIIICQDAGCCNQKVREKVRRQSLKAKEESFFLWYGHRPISKRNCTKCNPFFWGLSNTPQAGIGCITFQYKVDRFSCRRGKHLSVKVADVGTAFYWNTDVSKAKFNYHFVMKPSCSWYFCV